MAICLINEFSKLQEAEWIGLSWSQAIEKQQRSNFRSYQDQPMKIRLAKELLERLDGKCQMHEERKSLPTNSICVFRAQGQRTIIRSYSKVSMK